MKKDVYVKRVWEEGHVQYYFHFHNDYVVRQIEIASSRILKFSAAEKDIMYDQPLALMDASDKQDYYITMQDFEHVWNDKDLQNGIEFIPHGDIFAIKGVTSYAHGCNCAGAMGAGIALQFKRRFPKMYKEYHRLCKAGLFRPGDVYDFDYGRGHVYNLGTQDTWQTRAKLGYIVDALEKMMAMAEQDGVKSIALPAIGAGLGGLQWLDVKAVLKDIARYHQNVLLYVVECFSHDISINNNIGTLDLWNKDS